MRHNMLRFLMIVLFAGCVEVMAKPAQKDTVSCAVAASDRVECGWFGITKEICLARGCCWDSSISNAKYCFVKSGIQLPPEMCPIIPADRKDCGYFGIKKDECLGKGCCWDDTVPGAKFCYYNKRTSCYIYHGVRGICRYSCSPGESKMYGMARCKGTVCCYTIPWSK